MTTKRGWRAFGLFAVVLLSASTGCTFFISLDEITEDRPGDAGAGNMDARDVSNGTIDVSADAAAADTGAGMTRADANSGAADATQLSDAGPSDSGLCANPMFPVSCPALGSPSDGGVPAGCWTAATDCSTVKNCGGTYHACGIDYRFDCATSRCVLTCTDPMYPVMCPAVGSPADGGTLADCWTAGTDCSTVRNCNGTAHACRASYVFDCTANQCFLVADGAVRDGGGNADSACSNGCPGGNSCFAGQCCTPPLAGGVCSLPACGCSAGRVCHPDTMATGLQCFASGGLGEGQDCTAMPRGGCAAGLGCIGGVCGRYCSTDAECPLVDTARSCSQAFWSANQPVAGVFTCVRVCDPVRPQNPNSPLLACPLGFGCIPDVANPGPSDCIQQLGTGVTGTPCTTYQDCAPGFICDSDLSLTCFKWCFTNLDCPTGTCTLGSTVAATPFFAGAREVGLCTP
jgi:hypothetical protein